MPTYYMTPGGAGLLDGLSPANAFGYTEFLAWDLAASLPGDILYVGPGTYVGTASTAGVRDGTVASRISVIGVGDLNYPENTPIGTDRPLIAMNAGFRFWFDDDWDAFNFRLTGNLANSLLRVDTRGRLSNIDVDNAGAGEGIYLGASYCSIADCRARSVGGRAISSGAWYNSVDRCIAWGSPVGIHADGSYIALTNNLVYDCVTGINYPAADVMQYVVGNTLYDCPTGILAAGAITNSVFMRNIIAACTAGAQWAAAQPSNRWDYNVWFDNATDVVNVTIGRHAIQNEDPQFVDPTTFDFRVRNEAVRNIGANLITLGAIAPSIYEGGATGIAGTTPIDLSGDQMFLDGRETVWLDGAELQNVVRLEEEVSEQVPSEGVYQSRNVEFQLPYGAALYPGDTVPSVNGIITDGTNTYVILSVAQPEFSNCWRCQTRAMDIVGTYDLDNTVTLYPAVESVDAHGSKITAHTVEHPTFKDVPAKIMLRPSVGEDRAGQRDFVEIYDIYVDAELVQLHIGDVVQDETAKAYSVMSYRSRDRIEELSVIECECKAPVP